LLETVQEYFESLSMNGKSSTISSPLRSSWAPSKDSQRVFQ